MRLRRVKNRNKSAVYVQEKPSYKYPIPVPAFVNVDELGVALEEDLFSSLRALEDDRQKIIDVHMDTRPWEEEIAYLKRELQMRKIRREAHSRYLEQTDQGYSESDANLPFADLDNSAFLKLVGEWN